MKTLQEKYVEWAKESTQDRKTSDGQSMYQIELGYIKTLEAFMAGAAAMAEIFANGQGLKVEQAKREYRVNFKPYCFGGVSTRIVSAYSKQEALETVWRVEGLKGAPDLDYINAEAL